jgi:hypothetical protein
MKNAIFVISVLASSLFAGAVHARELKEIVPEVAGAAANSLVVRAVKEQNVKDVSLAKIQEFDKSWIDTTDARKELNRQPWRNLSSGRQLPRKSKIAQKRAQADQG